MMLLLSALTYYTSNILSICNIKFVYFRIKSNRMFFSTYYHYFITLLFLSLCILKFQTKRIYIAKNILYLRNYYRISENKFIIDSILSVAVLINQIDFFFLKFFTNLYIHHKFSYTHSLPTHITFHLPRSHIKTPFPLHSRPSPNDHR